MGIVNGKLLRVYLGTVAVAKATQCNASFSREMRETSHKDSGGYVQKEAGIKSATFSSSGFVDFDDAGGVDALYAAWDSGADVVVNFSTEVTGDSFWSAPCKITSLEIDAPNEENVTWSVNFESNGTITKAAVV